MGIPNRELLYPVDVFFNLQLDQKRYIVHIPYRGWGTEETQGAEALSIAELGH
jgi:hypothetical protein